MTTIGERIRHARNAAGLTQEQLAVACGCTQRGTVSNWETDKQRPPVETFVPMAKALNVRAGWLAFGE